VTEVQIARTLLQIDTRKVFNIVGAMESYEGREGEGVQHYMKRGRRLTMLAPEIIG
jgi:hypothetical protein